jgi:hypothetical protein
MPRTRQVEIGANKRRPAESSKDFAFLRRPAGNALVDDRPKTLGVRTCFGEAAGQGADEIAVGIEAKHRETRKSALV